MPNKFSFAKVTDVLFKNIEDVTGLPDSHVSYVSADDIGSYPYAVWQITNPHQVEQTSLDKQSQIFDVAINLNLYDENNPAHLFEMVQSLSQVLFNPAYERQLHDVGAVLADVKPNGSPVSDIASANGIYTQNLLITLRLSVQYLVSYKSYYRILNTNLNRPYHINY